MNNSAGIYNANDRKRLPAEPHKLWKVGCSVMHALTECSRVTLIVEHYENVKLMQHKDNSVAETRMLSPLRYPGGKGGLSKFLAAVLQANNCAECYYYEPFAGGAGAALRLLADGKVSEIFLNDADLCIYAFWLSALNETERFVDYILNIPLNIKEWRKQQTICLDPATKSIFDIGFATFYLNRCNRSGILIGAGPIGGYEQKGKWHLDERFNRENLSSRILQLGKFRKRIHVSNLDAIEFLSSILPKRKNKSIVFLDPPYFKSGRRLYYNFYRQKDHQILSSYLLRQKTLKWVMTYDNSDFIRNLYRTCQEYMFSLNYSLQKNQKAFELLIFPYNLILPSNSDLNAIKMDLQCICEG